MNIVINYILIAAIVIVAALLLRRVYQKLSQDEYADIDEMEEDESGTSLNDFEEIMQDNFSKYLRQNLKEENLTEAQYKQKEREHTKFSKALSLAAYGDEASKRVVISHIVSLLNSNKLGLSTQDLNEMIPFDNLSKLKTSDKWQIMAYLYMKKYKKAWLSKLIEDFHFNKGVDRKGDGRDWFWVSEEDFEAAFNQIVDKSKDNGTDNKLGLNKNDKVAIIAQKAFEDIYGLGVADLIINSDVDELDVGVHGKGYDSVVIMYHGRQIKFDFLTCGSYEELARVTDNIYKYDAPYVMSKTDAKIVATMPNGGRITAARPPFGENYSFWLRLFDSTPGGASLRQLLNKKGGGTMNNADILIGLMAWANKGHQTIGVTGSTGTGKTTLLKALIDFIDPSYSIGIAEKQFEMNPRGMYPDRNIISFQETDSINTQDCLDFLKKCNRQVNIIGEVAEAIQAYYVIQTSGVASFYTMFTSHHDTTRKLVESFASNMMSVGQAASMEEAIKATVNALNLDVHIVNDKGFRHVERVTEIIPVEKNAAYPSESMETSKRTGEEALRADTIEYYKRITDPDLYVTRDLLVYDDDTFYLVNKPSPEMMKRIERVVSERQFEIFKEDIELWWEMSENYRVRKGA